MKTYKTETVEVIDDVLCDCCGESTTINTNVGPDYATLEGCWGYGSEKMTTMNISLEQLKSLIIKYDCAY